MVQPAGVTPDAPPPIVRPQEVPEAVDNYFRALIQRARLEIFDEVIAAGDVWIARMDHIATMWSTYQQSAQE